MNTVSEDQERFRMWCSLIPGYEQAPKNKKKKMKLKYANMKRMTPFEVNQTLNKLPLSQHAALLNNLFSAFPCTSPASGSPNMVLQDIIPNSKEMKMNVNAVNPELVQREYLDSRLWQSTAQKDRELQKHFGLTDEDRPQTLKEMIKRIKADQYILPKHVDEEDDEDRWSPYDLMSVIRWRDPAKKEDKKGYAVSKKKLDEASRDVKGHVMILDLEKALKSVESFEEKKFH